MEKEIKVWHLELTRQPDAQKQTKNAYELIQLPNKLPEFNRFLYLTVGSSCFWYMRLMWTYDEWKKHLDNEKVVTWVAYAEGLPIGYFELEKQAENSTEIAYFGLLPSAIGKGFGKQLLEDAINKAWSLGGKRVWLHTCTLDHASALPNYLARGFSIFKEEVLVEEIPDGSIQPWHNAQK